MTHEFKKGILLTLVLVIAIIVFSIDLFFGIASLFFSAILETFTFIFGEVQGSSILASILQVVSGVVGVFSCISLWKLQKRGAYLFIAAVAMSLASNYLIWGALNYILISIYGIWVLIVLMNFKKLKQEIHNNR